MSSFKQTNPIPICFAPDIHFSLAADGGTSPPALNSGHGKLVLSVDNASRLSLLRSLWCVLLRHEMVLVQSSPSSWNQVIKSLHAVQKRNACCPQPKAETVMIQQQVIHLLRPRWLPLVEWVSPGVVTLHLLPSEQHESSTAMHVQLTQWHEQYPVWTNIDALTCGAPDAASSPDAVRQPWQAWLAQRYMAFYGWAITWILRVPSPSYGLVFPVSESDSPGTNKFMLPPTKQVLSPQLATTERQDSIGQGAPSNALYRPSPGLLTRTLTGTVGVLLALTLGVRMPHPLGMGPQVFIRLPFVGSHAPEERAAGYMRRMGIFLPTPKEGQRHSVAAPSNPDAHPTDGAEPMSLIFSAETSRDSLSNKSDERRATETEYTKLSAAEKKRGQGGTEAVGPEEPESDLAPALPLGIEELHKKASECIYSPASSTSKLPSQSMVSLPEADTQPPSVKKEITPIKRDVSSCTALSSPISKISHLKLEAKGETRQVENKSEEPKAGLKASEASKVEDPECRETTAFAPLGPTSVFKAEALEELASPQPRSEPLTEKEEHEPALEAWPSCLCKHSTPAQGTSRTPLKARATLGRLESFTLADLTNLEHNKVDDVLPGLVGTAKGRTDQTELPLLVPASDLSTSFAPAKTSISKPGKVLDAEPAQSPLFGPTSQTHDIGTIQVFRPASYGPSAVDNGMGVSIPTATVGVSHFAPAWGKVYESFCSVPSSMPEGGFAPSFDGAVPVPLLPSAASTQSSMPQPVAEPLPPLTPASREPQTVMVQAHKDDTFCPESGPSKQPVQTTEHDTYRTSVFVPSSLLGSQAQLVSTLAPASDSLNRAHLASDVFSPASLTRSTSYGLFAPASDQGVGDCVVSNEEDPVTRLGIFARASDRGFVPKTVKAGSRDIPLLHTCSTDTPVVPAPVPMEEQLPTLTGPSSAWPEKPTIVGTVSTGHESDPFSEAERVNPTQPVLNSPLTMAAELSHVTSQSSRSESTLVDLTIESPCALDESWSAAGGESFVGKPDVHSTSIKEVDGTPCSPNGGTQERGPDHPLSTEGPVRVMTGLSRSSKNRNKAPRGVRGGRHGDRKAR